MTNNEKIVELIGIFEKAKNKFLKEEKEIIKIDVNERTLSARLMFHLQTLLLSEIYQESYKEYYLVFHFSFYLLKGRIAIRPYYYQSFSVLAR